MKLSQLIFRSLFYYWRTNLAVIAGVAIAVAVLTGALLVGESVRASLRSLIDRRLGAAEYVISADRFFRGALADAFDSAAGEGNPTRSCAIIYIQGTVVREGTGARVHQVNVYGVDERFWRFHGASNRKAPEGRIAMVGEPLAQRLGLQSGDGLLLRVETAEGVPRESLFGRREETAKTMRLSCGEILPPNRLGEFALRPAQGSVYSIFVSLQRLQTDLAQPAKGNTILIGREPAGDAAARLGEQMRRGFDLEDAGVRVKTLSAAQGLSVESSRILLDQAISEAAFAAAKDTGEEASGIFAYLANSIRAGGREIPYSVICAADLGKGALPPVTTVGGTQGASTRAGERPSIWLNEWAWRDLGVSPGETVEVDYYYWLEEGRLATRTAVFQFAGVFPVGGSIDASFAPEFPGITDARSMTSWDPPFPLDLRRIRPRDEDYWDRYRASPKAVIPLSPGQALWQSRFGRLSAVRVAAPAGTDPAAARDQYAKRLRDHLDPERVGFSVTAVRKEGLEASSGSTDFGEYFLYFSFFLVSAALLFSSMFFRLGVEQRVREIGTLQSVGFPAQSVRRLFLAEGAILSSGGSLLGLIGAVGYGALMVLGLRTWWIGAVGTKHLRLYLSWPDLCLGVLGGVLVSLLAVTWTLRGLRSISPRALAAGVLESAQVKTGRGRAFGAAAALAFLSATAVLLVAAAGRVPDAAGFFGAGLLFLLSILSGTALYLRRNRPRSISGRGWSAFLRLGMRNAEHRPGRSVLCVALIASAAFVIVSVEAFRQDPRSVSLERGSGTGGYALVAQSGIPVVHDPNTEAGRDALGIPSSDVPELRPSTFVPFRVRPGDDASCLNLYAPRQPRILGAPHSFLAAGRFSFRESLATTPAEKRNPWLLLESPGDGGTVSAIADANTIQYILHLSIGGELSIRGSDGRPVRLRLVGSLRDSILQGELVISEANFLRVFPRQEGYRFFLIDTPPADEEATASLLMERLADWDFEVQSSRDRLAAYHRVENTYLSTFQSLGALGLVLGTAGLATVLLRNVLERRHELALLRAVGFGGNTLSVIVVMENVALMIWGLVSGTACALISILPALHARGLPFPIAAAALVLAAILAVGLLSSCLAAMVALRAPLLDALKSE